ncbi:MAG: tRNA (adenosine(37)-N6)-threonylcarbamoyltransferase complex transferase subunit TsaD [Fimbriimonas sp.]|jgi:N6-L-threonylcarbamoyladenine synthase
MFSDSLFGKPTLAIESSCDETSAAVVVGQRVLSNVIASQAEMHERWGGVVPEAAARAHVQSVIPVIDEALLNSGLSLEDIGGIAVTNRPGLIGALSVGVTVAKALAFKLQIPLIGIDHLEGHLLAFLGLGVQPVFPMVSLLVSGGHSELVLIRGCGDYELLGQTRDDAAGEAFDKGARLLGLGYPGGRQIQEHAKLGNPNRYSLPRGLAKERYEMSFSGLKTAVLRLVEQEGNAISVPDAAASLQQAVCDALLRRLEHAIEDYQPASLGLCGGVAANSQLRSMVEQLGEQNGIAVMIPPFELCTDNAAMIGLAAQCHPIEDWEVGFELEPSPRSLLFSDQG